MTEATIGSTLPEHSPREAAVAHFAFPVVMGLGVALTITLIHNGIDPFVAFVAAQLPSFLAVIALERLVPYQEEWNRSHGDVLVDVKHLFSITIFGVLIDPGVRVIGMLIAVWLGSHFELSLWPTSWHLVFQLALALVIVELGQYWVHRLQHEVPLLWRFHALHHSAPRLYWLNAARFHPFDIGLNNVVATIPLVALGAGIDVFMLVLLVQSVHGIFQHANMPIRIGPLNWVFSMAELHRWHHSRLVRESNTNYGQTLSIWDTVFGTRFLPADREPPRDIGLSGLDAFPMTYWAQLTAPFRWSKIVTPPPE